MSHDIFRSILREYWGYPDFRGIQRDIIDSIASGQDTLGLMPTGGGKSITFQVPALAAEGTCLVITPLIALMKDQVAALRKRGVKAAAIYSGMSREDIVQVYDNVAYGGVKILYLSPERISTELFQMRLSQMNVSFIAVDEAHCISQWGYDFRPSYLHIADLRTRLQGKPVLALTATATPKVVSDIQDKLSFQDGKVFSMSFARKNLSYVVRHTTDKTGEMLHVLQSVQGTAIVYTRSRQKTKEVSDMLNAAGISATFYHAGLEHAVRDSRQRQWIEGRQRVMVATNAFGMGIDKADVRLVIHVDTPDSLEAYFQEAGRAGRDGKRAYAVLLSNDGDKRRLSALIDETYPDKGYIKKVYDDLAYFFSIASRTGAGQSFSFDIDTFCHTFHHFPTRLMGALQALSRCGYIDYEADPDTMAKFMFTIRREDLNVLQPDNPIEREVILFVLRNYPGVFSTLVNVDEAYIASKTGYEVHQMYVVLNSLAQKRVAQFVPKRKTPYIKYRCERVTDEEFFIPPSAYEELKQRYVERVSHVISYINNGNVCRSRQLLHYFGERRSGNCGMCDVCRRNDSKGLLQDDSLHTPHAAIMQMLSAGKRVPITDLLGLPYDSESVQKAVRELLMEEKIQLSGDDVSLPQ